MKNWMLACPALLTVALISAPASALDRVPGTQMYYSSSKDPITDVNTSLVAMYEVNDTYGDTVFYVRCSNHDQPEIWASLNSKHELQSQEDADLGLKPAITIRLGDDAPLVLPNADLATVVNASDVVKTQSIGFSGATVRRMVNGLNAGKRLVIRINRSTGGQALTYTFSSQGFPTAWAMVGGCNSGRGTTTAPRPVVTGAAAPKFTKWYFTTCRDANTGAVRTGLIAGRAHLCDLVIETIPNGAQPISADFRYELEYREGNRTGKLMLDSVDYWPSGSGAQVKSRQSGSNLIFTLPLNVRVRPDRVYTSINVTGNVYFNNGSSKKVYEPLPVKPAY